jgi:glutamine amidotransferase
MSVGILNIGVGNQGSLRNALNIQGFTSVLVSTPGDFKGLTHLILPGVGAFSVAVRRLHQSDLYNRIKQFAIEGNPILGICLGMQLLADFGTEGGDHIGLGLVPGHVSAMIAESLPLPHIGWNNAHQTQSHPVLKGIRKDIDFYFVHSYRFVPEYSYNVFAETEYGTLFPSIVGNRNVIGVQFHPEKSQVAGLRLLENFCLWDGKC